VQPDYLFISTWNEHIAQVSPSFFLRRIVQADAHTAARIESLSFRNADFATNDAFAPIDNMPFVC